MDGDPLIIERGLPLLKISGRGRPKGSGSNLRALARMKSGDSIWEVPPKKKDSFRTSAHRARIKISIRRIPLSDGTLSNNYAIYRL